MCLCVHVYIGMYRRNVNMDMHVCKCVIHVYACTYIHTHMYGIMVSTYVLVCAYVRMYIRTCVYTYVYMHTYVHMYVCTYSGTSIIRTNWGLACL